MNAKVVLVCLIVAVVGASATTVARMHGDGKCGGKCLDMNKNPCKYGAFTPGKCGGGANIQCCEQLPAVPGVGAKCAGFPGVCQLHSSPCAGTYMSGVCPGAAGVQCCMPGAAPAAPTAPRVVPTAPVYAGQKCRNSPGVCQLSSSPCAGKLTSGLCAGPSNIQCCVPASATPAAPANNSPRRTPEPEAPAPVAPAAGGTAFAPFSKIWRSYPHGEAEEVKQHIGGGINADYITNTCVIRVARAFSQAGMKIGSVRLSSGAEMLKVKGANGVGLPIRVREFNQYMRATYGAPRLHVKTPDGGDGFDDIPSALAGKKGIISFDVRVWDDATGHFDLWDGKECAHKCYFDKAREVMLWPVA